MEPISALQRRIAELNSDRLREIATQNLKLLDGLQASARLIRDQMLSSTGSRMMFMENQLRDILRPASVDASLSVLKRLGVELSQSDNATALALTGIASALRLEAIFTAVPRPVIANQLRQLLEFTKAARLTPFDGLPVPQFRYTTSKTSSLVRRTKRLMSLPSRSCGPFSKRSSRTRNRSRVIKALL